MDFYETVFSKKTDSHYLTLMKLYLVHHIVGFIHLTHFDLYKNSNNLYKQNYNNDSLKIHLIFEREHNDFCNLINQ